jgi:histidinol dehydrogenase
MLSQAEHGRDSQAIVVCSSCAIAEAVDAEVDRQRALLSREEYVAESLASSRAIVFDSREDMIAFADEYAAEHLIISMENAWDVAAQITSAGSVFIGNYSPESAGDYASGTNHTLPTSGWAHSCSGVNIDSYMRKMTIQSLTREGIETLAPTIIAMAEAEGLEAHAAAVKVRIAK